jgi:hypothetical protein
MVKLATKLEPGRAQLQLKVTLEGIKPAIWRRMLVSANIELPTFHAVLQHAFDWTNSHLHPFRIGDQSYETYDPDLWEDWPGGPEKLDEGEFRLCDLLHAKGDRLTYLYDFGDGWRHDVLIEKDFPRLGLRRQPALPERARPLPRTVAAYQGTTISSRRWRIRATPSTADSLNGSGTPTIPRRSLSR